MAELKQNLVSNDNWVLVTSQAAFTAQNAGDHTQWWTSSTGAPAGTAIGIEIMPGQGADDSFGSEDLYARGFGTVVVVY